MNAALLMAKTASLLRCLGKSIKEPGRLLTIVNDEICETVTRGMFVTLVHGIYSPDCGHVRLANAGHEPPLILSNDGSFSAIEAEAPPLGIMPSMAGIDSFPETEFSLDDGKLFVFTDGVTEGYIAEGEELGIDGLKQILTNPDAPAMAEMLSNIAGKIGSVEGALRDDVTIIGIDDGVVMHSSDVAAFSGVPGANDVPGEKLMQLRVSAKPNRLKLIRNAVREASEFCGFSKTDVNDIILAVDEACQNVIRHAYGGESDEDISIELRQRPDAMVIFIRDFADPVDVSKVKPRDLDDIRPGGLSTHLIQEVMDHVDFLPPPIDGGNLLRLVKKIER